MVHSCDISFDMSRRVSFRAVVVAGAEIKPSGIVVRNVPRRRLNRFSGIVIGVDLRSFGGGRFSAVASLPLDLFPEVQTVRRRGMTRGTCGRLLHRDVAEFSYESARGWWTPCSRETMDTARGQWGAAVRVTVGCPSIDRRDLSSISIAFGNF